MEKTISIPLAEDDPTKVMQISSLLDEEIKARLTHFQQSNTDVFTWSAFDMPGIPAKVITHRLEVIPDHKPVLQKKSNFAPERQKVIDEEVNKLLNTGFIKEVHYLDWLANVVMMKKSNGK